MAAPTDDLVNLCDIRSRNEEKNVLCPLVDADGFDHDAKRGPAVVKEHATGTARLRTAMRNPPSGRKHGNARLAQHGQVGPRVADVVKFAELVSEADEFFVP